MATESSAERVLKLPLDSPFDGREGRSRERDHDHHGGASNGQLDNQNQHQQEDTEHFDAVSLSGSVPPGFGSVADDNLMHNGGENEKVSPMKKQQDSTLTAAAAAAVASIQDVWSENFNEPLPTNKEERIQQALEFMNSEKQAHDSDKTIKKHSIRQIALFFQVPKSTLYDRLKSKNNDMNANSIMKSLSHRNVGSKPYAGSASRSHQQQMKLSIEKEDILLNEVRNLCHSYGNTLNYTQIREFIMSLVNGISLGKKWVHNFTRRHDDFIIYGTYKSQFNVKMKKSKNCKCNFDHLWRCFIPLLQEKIKTLPHNKPFYYITRTCIHHQSMSSVFTCFEIIPNEFSIKMMIPPKLLIFPDYFGKIYLHQDLNQIKGSNERDDNNDDQSIKIGTNNENNNNLVSGDTDDNNDGLESGAVDNDHERFKHASLNSELNCNGNNLSEEVTDPTLRVNKQEGKQGQLKIDKLNEVFAKVYSECCQRSLNHEVPFVVFEGFDDRYNWNILTCKDMVQTDNFLSLPWNQQLFQHSLNTGLREAVNDVTQASSIAAIESSFYETELENYSLDLETFSREFHHVVNIQTEHLNVDDSQEHVSEQLNDLNVFEPVLQAAATASTATSSHNEIRSQKDSLEKSTQPSHIESVTSANIFENSTISQLQDVINMIDNNESQLYGDLMSPNSKTILMTIFNKIKGIVPQ